jgi:hypothetical protein
MFQLSNYDILYCSDLHEAFTVFQTKVHLKSSIKLSMMKSRKEKMILQYISPQMSRQADILVKLLSKMKEFLTQARARGNNFLLIGKGRNDSPS